MTKCVIERTGGSLIPIPLRALPPLVRNVATNERDPEFALTVVGLVVLRRRLAGVLVLLDIE